MTPFSYSYICTQKVWRELAFFQIEIQIEWSSWSLDICWQLSTAARGIVSGCTGCIPSSRQQIRPLSSDCQSGRCYLSAAQQPLHLYHNSHINAFMDFSIYRSITSLRLFTVVVYSTLSSCWAVSQSGTYVRFFHINSYVLYSLIAVNDSSRLFVFCVAVFCIRILNGISHAL